MAPAVVIAVGTLVAVLAVMAGELALSAFNTTRLRARGAVEPPGDVYAAMRWAYPLGFVAMAAEGAWRGPAPAKILVFGLVVFGLAKALKAWAMATLGPRWSFRVLVPPGDPPTVAGPYALIDHPNYVAVCGEIVGVACLVAAPVSGALFLVGFGWLMRRRIAVEDRALGRPAQ
jgi:methyltransferase